MVSNCEHCSCYEVKEKRCCYCHEEGSMSRMDEMIRKNIIKVKTREKTNES